MQILIFIFAYFLQLHLLLSGDVGYLLYVANQVLAGGTYAKDFLETNPPMIFYLYTPACLLTKLTGLNIILSVRLYILFLISLSFNVCLSLIKHLIQPQDKFLYFILYSSLLFILLFLPAYHFGQREHLLLILMLPYLFASVLYLENKPISYPYAFLIGLLAGLGFALKPFFLPPLILVELYIMLYQRRFSSVFRIETFTIACVLIIYLGSILIFQPNYIHIMLPLISHLYFNGMIEPWPFIFSNPTVYFCLAVFLSYLLFSKQRNYHHLSTVFFLALIGMIAAFIIPQSAWYYHVIPALGLASLLIAFCLGREISNPFLFLAVCAVFLFIPVNQSYKLYKQGIYLKNEGAPTKLAAYINSLPEQHSIFCFSTRTPETCFPLVYNTHSLYSGRYPFFWWLKGLLKKESSGEVIEKDKQFLVSILTNDLNHKHNLIIISPEFDFITYFSKDERFRQVWQHYTYLITIDGFQLYAYD